MNRERRIVIYLNSNLNISRGKYAAQAVHAALMLLGVHPDVPVIVLGATPTLIKDQAQVLVNDAGRTELKPGTLTAGALWEGDSEPRNGSVRRRRSWWLLSTRRRRKALEEASTQAPRPLWPVVDLSETAEIEMDTQILNTELLRANPEAYGLHWVEVKTKFPVGQPDFTRKTHTVIKRRLVSDWEVTHGEEP